MSRKQQNSFGVVARTGFSLLALGFGSAMFGAMIVGPLLGKQLGHDQQKAARPSGGETQLASTVLNDGASAYGSRSSRREEQAREESEPKDAEKPNADAQFVEGTGAETVSSNAGSYTGPTEDPDATSADVNETPKATIRSEPFTKPGSLKVEAPKPVETPKERPAAEPVRPKRSDPAERNDADRPPRDRESSRERDARRETEKARSHETDEKTRERNSDRREESTPAREERKSSRDRAAAEPTRVRTRDGERVADRRETARKSEKVEKTETAKASDPPSEAETERAAAEAKLYRVRVGRVHPRDEAEKLRDELKGATGVEAFLVPVGDGFQIQTGAYKNKSNAEKIAATLRAGNFLTVVRQDR